MSSSLFTKCTLPVVLLVITKYSPSQKHIFVNEVGKQVLSSYIIFTCVFYLWFLPEVFHISRRNVNDKTHVKSSYEDLFIVWRRIRPETFGHVMGFLTAVHLQDLSENKTRYVVRLTVPVLKNINLSKYKREKSILDNYTLVRSTVHRFLHRYVCRRLDLVLCYCYIIEICHWDICKKMENIGTSANYCTLFVL